MALQGRKKEKRNNDFSCRHKHYAGIGDLCEKMQWAAKVVLGK